MKRDEMSMEGDTNSGEKRAYVWCEKLKVGVESIELCVDDRIIGNWILNEWGMVSSWV